MRVTFHGTLLGVILLVLAMMAIGPARQFYDEQQVVRSDQAQLAAGRAESARLTARIARLQDPTFIEQLARQELGYIKPGETPYLIVHPVPSTAPAPAAPAVRAKAPSLVQETLEALTRALRVTPL